MPESPVAGQRVEDAAGTARAKAEGLGEAAKEKATELKDAAACKADDISASLRKEQESGMTATERASGRQSWRACVVVAGSGRPGLVLRLCCCCVV